jgi:hypothetical protein
MVLVAAGCGSGTTAAPARGPGTPGPEESLVTDLPASPTTAGECGAVFVGTTPGPLVVTAQVPATVASREQVLALEVSAAARAGVVRGVVTPQAEAFLVRDDRVVTLPVPQDSVGRGLRLGDGAVQRLPTTATLVPCSGAGALAPGGYDLYVRVVLNHDDGSRTDSLGGPWPLTLR